MKKFIITITLILTCIGLAAAEVAFEPFRKPQQCVDLQTKHGFKAYKGVKPIWKSSELGWYSQTQMTTHKGGLTKVGDVDNDMTCYFSGEKSSIKFVRIKANCYNPEGAAATLKAFKKVVAGLSLDLGVADPNKILSKVDPVKGKTIDTDTYTIEIKRDTFKLGYGWVFTLTTK